MLHIWCLRGQEVETLSSAEHRVVIEVRASLGSRRILLCDGTASALRLPGGRVAVSAGTATQTVTVGITDKIGVGSLALGPSLAARLGLRSGDSVTVLVRRRALRIGPYVGILTAPTGRPATSNRCYGRDTEYLREVCMAGRRLGLVTFVFSYDSADLSKGRLTGRVPEPVRYGKWHSRSFPTPDVIFNRIPTRGQERSAQVRRLIDYCSRHESTKLFNSGFMDKWSVYAQLSNHRDLKNMMPRTAIFRGTAMLKEWLARYRSVYLKPINGSLGEGIIVVQTVGRGVVCRYRNRRMRPVSEYSPRVEGIYGRVQQIIAGRRYLIQPDLRLLSVDQSPFDVRLLMQRNMNGKWIRTKMFARVARRGEYASNISRGGSGVPLEEVLGRVLPGRAEQVARAVRRAGALVARAMEETAQSPVGELGIDIGIDRNLNLWLIEVNSKPHVDVVKPSTTNRAREASVSRPMEFAVYLFKSTLKQGKQG